MQYNRTTIKVWRGEETDQRDLCITTPFGEQGGNAMGRAAVEYQVYFGQNRVKDVVVTGYVAVAEPGLAQAVAVDVDFGSRVLSI
jgi:hypothetical protein